MGFLSLGIIDRHSALSDLAEFWYVCRKDFPEAGERARWACNAQIAFSAEAWRALRAEHRQFGDKDFRPAHTGYERLCLMLKASGEFSEAKKVAAEAEKKGWSGNWERFKNLST